MVHDALSRKWKWQLRPGEVVSVVGQKGSQSGTCLPLTQSQMMTRTLLGVMAMEWARILDKCNRASFMHVTECFWNYSQIVF